MFSVKWKKGLNSKDLINQEQKLNLWLKKRLETFENNNDDLCKYGVEVVSRMCEKLFEGGAPGLHFYSMNRSDPIIAIIENLGFSAVSPQYNLENF